MSGARVGYVRVSTVEQNTDRQLDGLELDNMFKDKVSGWSMGRPGWRQCKEYLRKGDTLYVHSIDRLARNLVDLQNTVKELTEKGIAIEFVKEKLTFQGKSDPFQMLMFQMVGAFAQFERALIKERQREGIEKAKAAGRYKDRRKGGAKPKLTPEQVTEALKLLADGMPKTKVAKLCGLTPPRIYAMLDKEKRRGQAA
jgi:DNA invertase Pin-like site-specific DNA recombinase